MALIRIISTDEDPSLRIESFCDDKFTWCFHKAIKLVSEVSRLP